MTFPRACKQLPMKQESSGLPGQGEKGKKGEEEVSGFSTHLLAPYAVISCLSHSASTKAHTPQEEGRRVFFLN